MLLIIIMAAFVPDFDSGIGIASLFPLAATFKTTPTVINNQTSNWSIFLLGWGGIFAYVLGKKWGRLPVLFWSQLIGLGFLVGCAAAPTLTTFTAMRCLTAVFSTAPQVTGLYVITDLFPFHLQSRKTSLWGFGYLVSPFTSPWVFGYFVARQSWRWAYGIGCFYSLIVVLLIAFFMEETIYDRHLSPIPARPTTGVRYRIETLLGITAIKMSKYRPNLWRCFAGLLSVIWRPNVIAMMFYVGISFGLSIGINVTTAQFIGEPRVAGGYGFKQDIIATIYLTPIVGIILGEVIGRYLNDWLADRLIKRNNGVFVAEMRLWALWIAVPLFVLGMCLYGYAIQQKSFVALMVIGWGLFEIAIMITVIGTINYERDCYPRHAGEIAALVNLSRTLGGFAIPYWQYPWAVEHGALKEAGWEVGIIAGLFLLIVPLLQWKGEALRHRFGEKTE